jgi:CheY-like chemotaxis protein
VKRPVKPVLVVEDHDDTREMVELILRLDGYTVCTARDGAEALELTEREMPCLILLDVTMPVMDGITFARKMRKSRDAHLAATPIVLLTALSSIDDAMAQTGAVSVVEKPIDIDRVLAEVERYCVRANGDDRAG